MTCMRCHGFLVATSPLFWSSRDYQPAPEDELEMQAWQCVNCGDYIDAVILANRTALRVPAKELSEPLVA